MYLSEAGHDQSTEGVLRVQTIFGVGTIWHGLRRDTTHAHNLTHMHTAAHTPTCTRTHTHAHIYKRTGDIDGRGDLLKQSRQLMRGENPACVTYDLLRLFGMERSNGDMDMQKTWRPEEAETQGDGETYTVYVGIETLLDIFVSCVDAGLQQDGCMFVCSLFVCCPIVCYMFACYMFPCYIFACYMFARDMFVCNWHQRVADNK